MVELQSSNESFLTVLHVDDDESFLRISKKILEMEGNIKVETSTSVFEAFENLKQFHYDVIVSDYEMPNINGFQFLLELKQAKPTVHTLHGQRKIELAVKAINLGAFRYLSKYGGPEAVYSELASCIHQAARSVKFGSGK